MNVERLKKWISALEEHFTDCPVCGTQIGSMVNCRVKRELCYGIERLTDLKKALHPECDPPFEGQ